MKSLLLIMSLGVLISCSSVDQKRDLSQRIKAEEARSFQEIQSHADILLDDHPELDANIKRELKTLLKSAIQRHQELKEKESRIFQLLLEDSLKANQLTAQEKMDKNFLMTHLSEVYQEKSNNVLSLIKRIVKLTEEKTVTEDFNNDLRIFFRDFR